MSAPQFKATACMANEKFDSLSLTDYRGKWVVLFFYPFDFTYVCPTEIVSFSNCFDPFMGCFEVGTRHE